MASLNLRLEKKYLDADVNLGVVARVQQTAGPGSATAETLEVVIPAGRYNSKRVEVPVGTYQIEARLPSGEVLRERREVGANENVDVVFQAGQSPHEWLSLQRLAGNVPSQQEFEGWLNNLATRAGEAAKRKNLLPSKSIHVDPEVLGTTATFLRGAHLRLQPAMASVASAASNISEWFSGAAAAAEQQLKSEADATPEFRLVDSDPARGEAHWDALATLSAWKAFEGGAQTSGRCSPDPPIDAGPITLWRIKQQPPPEQASRTYVPSRSFALSRRGVGVDVISLPVPWPLNTNFPPVPVEVLREAGIGTTGRTTLTVCDPQIGGLLLYLKNAKIGAASTVLAAAAEQGLIEELIEEKLRNPLAACAAAYVGLATLSGAEPPRWAPWLANVSNWFPWVPDGAIVHGAYLMKTATTQEDLDLASAAFVDAYRRGLPFYTAGVQQLMQGLYMFAGKSPEIAAMHKKVSAVALRVDAEQTFTVVTVDR